MSRQFFKISGCGVSYSVVPQGNLEHVYLTTGSGIAETPEHSVQNLLKTVGNILNREKIKALVLDATVFLNDIALKELLRQEFRSFFAENLPAITYVPQTNCDGDDFSLELHAVRGAAGSFEIRRLSEQSVRLNSADLSIIYCSDILPNRQEIKSYDRSFSAFQNMNSLLSLNGFPLSQLYRTWIHQGHIVAPEGETQRYKELNHARTEFFSDTKFLKNFAKSEFTGTVYPASTGIGADDYDVVISAQAMKTTRKDVVVTPLENPEQTSAFDYGEVYSPRSPKFARAMAFVVGKNATIFVSGTASITDSESRHPGDPVRQTEQTLDNIAALISGKNLAKHGISGYESGLDELATARVYVKNIEDYPLIRDCCERRFGTTPVIYTVADVCRPELLVEIEGIAIPRLVSP